MEPHRLSLDEQLRALREDIAAENTLISGRMTWYVTSQAFLLTAYATSWNAGFVWPSFFHQLLPIAAIGLSVLTLASVYAATWAQDSYIRVQVDIVGRIKASGPLSATEALAIDAYERTMIPFRTGRDGRVRGTRFHWLVRISPLVLPVGFVVLWLYAYLQAPI